MKFNNNSIVGTRSIINDNLASSCFFRSSAIPPYRKSLLKITDRCNLNCVHCFISSSNQGDVLSVENIQNLIIPRMIKCGVNRVTLTGGEPFTHPHIIKIVQLFRQVNMGVGICTNGTLIHQNQIEMLSKIENVHINVSLHGFKLESHNNFTGNNTAFQKATRTIKQLGRYDLLKGLLVTPNCFADVEEYAQICNFAIQNNASYVLMNPLSSMGRGVKSKKIVAAHDKMMYKIQNVTAKFNKDIQIVYIRFPNKKLPLSSCEVSNIIYVFVNGNVAVCPYLVFASKTPDSKYSPEEFIVGNILSNSDITDRLNNYKFEEKYLLGNYPNCRDCHFDEKCGKGCSAAVIASGKRIGDVDSEVCPIENEKKGINDDGKWTICHL